MNLDFGRNFRKCRCLSKISTKNIGFGRNFGKISIVVETLKNLEFGWNFWENLDFGRNFWKSWFWSKISILIKISENSQF